MGGIPGENSQVKGEPGIKGVVGDDGRNPFVDITPQIGEEELWDELVAFFDENQDLLLPDDIGQPGEDGNYKKKLKIQK